MCEGDAGGRKPDGAEGGHGGLNAGFAGGRGAREEMLDKMRPAYHRARVRGRMVRGGVGTMGSRLLTSQPVRAGKAGGGMA